MIRCFWNNKSTAQGIDLLKVFLYSYSNQNQWFAKNLEDMLEALSMKYIPWKNVEAACLNKNWGLQQNRSNWAVTLGTLESSE